MPYFSQAGSAVKMAVGAWLLNGSFLNSKVNKTIVWCFVQRVGSQLPLPCHSNQWGRRGGACNYMVIVPKQAVGRANVQPGLGQHDC